MTKLEAWKKWCEEAHVTDATEYTLEMSSHGKAFSYAWDVAVEEEREACAEIADKCMEDSQRYVATTEREKNCMEAMLVLSEEFAIAIRARGNDND